MGIDSSLPPTSVPNTAESTQGFMKLSLGRKQGPFQHCLDHSNFIAVFAK